MTTKVTVNVGGKYLAKVTATGHDPVTVEPGEDKDFYVPAGGTVTVEELEASGDAGTSDGVTGE